MKYPLFLFAFMVSSLSWAQNNKLIWPFYTNAEPSIDIYNDFTFSAEDPNEEINDLYLEAKFSFYTYFTNNIYLYNSFNIEPVKDPKYGENRAFSDIGLWWDNLNLNFETDIILIGVGRGAPNFSIGYIAGPGIWGSDDSYDNLKTGDKWGIAVAPNISLGVVGDVSISASLFMADNTTLSDSYITRRGVFYREYGGPSNTGKLNSYAISIDGLNISILPDLQYHFGYMNQKVEQLSFDMVNYISTDSLDNEQRFVMGLLYNYKIDDETILTPFIEYGSIKNDLGRKKYNKDILTTSLELNKNNWIHSIAYSKVKNIDFEGSNSDYSISYTVGYTFDPGIEANLGYKFSNGSERSYTHTFGTSASFTLNGRNAPLLGVDFLKLNHKKQLIYIKRYLNSHKRFLDFTDIDNPGEMLIEKLIIYIGEHPNSLNRPLQVSLVNLFIE